MDWQSQRTYIQSSLSKCTHRQEEKKPRKRDLILCCPWIHYCPLFSFLCAYISARWKHGSSGRDHVISAFFLHGCIIPSRCFSLRTRIKKKKRRRKRIGKERGQGCLFVNRESVITAKMCTGGDRWAKFPSNYSLGSQFVLYHQPEKNFSCVNREETTLFFIGRWPRWRAFVYEPLCFLRSSLFFSPLFCNAKHPLIKSMEPQQAKWNCSLCHFIPIILDFENLFLVVMLFYRKPKAS